MRFNRSELWENIFIEIKLVSSTMIIDPFIAKQKAVQMQMRGELCCSEAIVKIFKDAIRPDLPDETIAMASGFPMGLGGGGCLCGALAGGVMVLGMLFGRAQPNDPKVKKAMELSKELHEEIKKQFRSVCCRILTKTMAPGSVAYNNQCAEITGAVAETTARIINRETREDISFE
jgi:C_GCAxxG_C_C family probable redox protein